MFFIILGNVERGRSACAARHHQRAVRDAGSPGNTCGSAALHALPRAAARCGARHRGGGNLRGDSWQERSAVDGWTAAGGGPAVHVRAVLLLIWRYKAVPRLLSNPPKTGLRTLAGVPRLLSASVDVTGPCPA